MRRQKRNPSQRAYLKGYQLGFDGRSEDNCPYHHQSGSAFQWMRGWREGRADYWQGLDIGSSQQKVVSAG